MTDTIGLYIHIPFCVRKCNYCDFCSVARDDELIERYVDALCDEASSYKRSPKIRVDSVFFGGGTPSLLSPLQIAKINSAIRRAFDISADAEITAEINPGTVTREKLSAFFTAGVNRLSIGFQSMHENEQKMLGRIHNLADFCEAYDIAREVGFENINVDVMYGIPEQTLDSFEKTLSFVINRAPEHISCYGLIVEPCTPFYDKRDELPLPDEDTECDMYELACRMLSDAGYEHYEISNYARRGFYCKHNLKYWHDEEYIGIGLSAHSYYLGERLYTTSDFAEYFLKSGANYQYRERNTGRDAFEYAMLALRLAEGISLIKYEALFGTPFTRGREHIIKKYRDAGLLNVSSASISLTERGFYLSNTILAELI